MCHTIGCSRPHKSLHAFTLNHHADSINFNLIDELGQRSKVREQRSSRVSAIMNLAVQIIILSLKGAAMKLRSLSMVFAIVLLLGVMTPAVQAFPNLQVDAIAVIVAEGANLRAGPGTSFARVGSAAAGATLQVVGCSADCSWYQTAAGDWIAAELLINPPATLPHLNTETEPAPSPAPGAGTLRLPTPTPLARTTAVAVTGTAVAAANANLRSGPGTDFERLGSVQAGAALEVAGQTPSGDWLQLADGSWIAAFLVENVGAGLPVIENPPTPVTVATTPAVVPTAVEQTPEPPPVQETVAGAQAPGARDLVVEFINPHYNCEQGEYQFEKTPGIVEKIWAYRSFQADMYITNNSAEPIEPAWGPTRWIITDGANEMVNDNSWEWISRYSGRYPQPTIYPGQKAGWTWIVMPVGRHEWVRAVEFEYNGQLYRQEFDLGPYGNAHNYIDCGEPRVHKDYPTPTPRPQASSEQ